MTAAKFEAAALNVWQDTFASIAKSSNLTIAGASADDAAVSEAHAARFLLALLRQRPWLRWRFPQALSEGEKGRFCRWLLRHGRQKFGLSSRAITKIRGAFRRRMGKRVYDVYLNDPELQQLYPLGLVPIGQRHFLGWLTTHGRADQKLTDEQILWFLQESAEDLDRGVSLTYLLNPSWQEQFPLALTPSGWRPFNRWLKRTYGKAFNSKSLRSLSAVLSRPVQRSFSRSILGLDAPSAQARLQGVNMLGHFCNYSGLQQAALWTKAALERARLCTSCRDVPVPRPQIPRNRADWLGLEVFPITILTHAATPYFASAYERSGLYRRKEVYRIAYWYWELERVPDEWVAIALLVDEIWSPTPFVAQAMRAAMPVPVFDMLPGVEVGSVESVSREEIGVPQDHCVFLFMFDLLSQIHRKNPLGAIRAFRRAFRKEDAATLLIKAIGGDIFREDLAALREMARGENILLVHEMMSRSKAYGFVEMCDCFVSLHRSEGFGLGLAEAMLLGKPVIATGYSGNLAFMNRENSMLVDYEMVEIAEDRPVYTKGNHWAEPSIKQAAQYLRYVYENREEAAARARHVQPEIQRLLSLEVAGRRMRDRLEQITVNEGI